MSSVQIDLVPWDPTSEEHAARMLSQRRQCGWNADKIKEWQDKQLSGKKCMYWIIFPETEPKKDELVAKHTAVFPHVMG